NPVSAIFSLQRGDGRRGGLLFTYLFLIITCYQLGKTARDALFLSVFKASKLPYADMAIAVLVGVVIAIYVTIGRRVALRDLLVGCLLLFAVLQCGFWYLAKFHPHLTWQYPVFYIWVGILGVLAPTQVWTLANYLLTTREAKRIFGLVGAGGISGWIFSGILADLLATTPGLGTESLLLAMAIGLVGCAALVVVLWRERKTSPSAAPHAQPAPTSLRQSLSVVFSSPYLVSIAVLITLASLATCFAAWQFKAIAKAAYVDKNALTAFFGRFNFWAGLACLALQLILTSRFLRRFGLGPALLVVPLVVFGSEIAVFAAGTLAAAILLKGGDSVVRYSLDKSSVELLYLPIPPEVKLQAKSTIDTVIWRLGDGLAGFTLAIFTDQLHWSARRVSLVNLVFAGGWIAAAIVARRRYGDTLLQSIRQRRLDAERQLAPVLDRSTADILATQLDSADPKQVLYALDLLGAAHDGGAHPALRDLLNHEVPAVRQRALGLLDAAGDLWVLPRVEEMLRDSDAGVRSTALLFLAHHAPLDPLRRIQELDGFQDVSVMSGIVAFLAQSGDKDQLPEARLLLDRMIAERGEAGKHVRLEAASLLGTLDDFDDQLDALLIDEEPEVVRAAARAAGRRHKRHAAPRLIELLNEPRVREEAADALVAMGDRVLGALRDQLMDGDVPAALRLEVPALLARIGGQDAAAALVGNLLETDPELRFRTICALNDLRRDRPQTVLDPARLRAALGFEMMLHCRTNQILSVTEQGTGSPREGHPTEVGRRLEAARDREIERIFRILSLLYPGTDFRSAHYGLRSGDATARDHALEFLELALDGELRRSLVSLLDPTVSLDARLAPILKRTHLAAPTAADLAAALVASEDVWLKACGVTAIGALGLVGLAERVEECLDAEDEVLREAARAAKKQLAEDAATLSRG
ncbi:MAG TPA: Npt1/Npt2 family nucleotide transporter, partial [Burkholderiales bacterium]|nr:Npt1/Npt2 family nucleotide transporter [Burkholderiales bacterium]